MVDRPERLEVMMLVLFSDRGAEAAVSSVQEPCGVVAETRVLLAEQREGLSHAASLPAKLLPVMENQAEIDQLSVCCVRV